MTRGWDQWVWPLSMCERHAPKDVAKVCHAIALDDERHTFHPVLLDETDAEPAAHTDEERVTQVWFAGVHSNVGGGYPDDSLAHVSLLWMADEAFKKGLKFHAHIRNLWVARADPNGPIYDSRRGLGAYYRYNPRSIFKLTRDHFADVNIPRPKIHESVFRRIRSERDDYAPIVLPGTYDVVTAAPKHADQATPQGAILRDEQNPFEHPTQAAARAADPGAGVELRVAASSALLLDRVRDLRAAARSRALQGTDAAGGGSRLGNRPGTSRAGGWFPARHGPALRDLLAGACRHLCLPGDHPCGAAVLQHAGPESHRVSDEGPLGRHRDGEASRGWSRQTAGRPDLQTSVAPGVSKYIRIPVSEGIPICLRSRRAVGGCADRIGHDQPRPVHGEDRCGSHLHAGAKTSCSRVRTARGRRSQFNNRNLCQTAKIELQAGRTYEVSITLPKGWTDKSIPSDLTGISTSAAPWVYIPALPFRRVLKAPWFVPVARIGVWTPEYHMLTQTVTEITPRQTGQLFLFVNDAVGPPGLRSVFYDNNEPGPVDPAKVIVKEKVLTAASTSQ